jgi:hypothetical protein
MKLMKDTASLVNFMLANPNFHKPELDENVTELMWTDRVAYRVTAVDKDGRGCTITKYKPKFIGKCYGDERYKYDDENGNPLLSDLSYHIRYRSGKWVVVDSYNGLKTKGFPIHLAWGVSDEYRDPSF